VEFWVVAGATPWGKKKPSRDKKSPRISKTGKCAFRRLILSFHKDLQRYADCPGDAFAKQV